MQKANSRRYWKDFPSIDTQIDADILNEKDIAIDTIDDRVIHLDITKLDKVDAMSLIKDVTFDLQTGILTKYYYNGSTEEINTGISKLNMNLRFDKESQILYIVNADGTEDPIDLSVFITNYEFNDSDTISHNVSSDGTVTSIVKEGSIQEKHLQPNYLADIKVESAKAAASAKDAAASATSAASSAASASTSKDAAATSATSASGSATDAAESASAASTSAEESANSASAAATSATEADTSATTATQEASDAETSAANAAAFATSASGSASTATAKAAEASEYADKSKSYAVGTGGEVREDDDTDNAQYYYEQAKRVIQGVSGIVPMGTISFEGLSDSNNQKQGYMFNISDSFVSDERFQDGGGIFYGAGNNVLYTADGMWDVLAVSTVSGVKGDKEAEYRQGFINITPGNIGAVSTEASQGLSDAEKSNARANIGAGTSDFSGAYSDLIEKPTALPADGGNADTVDGYHIAVVTELPSDSEDNTDTFYVIPQ